MLSLNTLFYDLQWLVRIPHLIQITSSKSTHLVWNRQTHEEIVTLLHMFHHYRCSAYKEAPAKKDKGVIHTQHYCFQRISWIRDDYLLIHDMWPAKKGKGGIYTHHYCFWRISWIWDDYLLIHERLRSKCFTLLRRVLLTTE